jgi:Tol biopolymer transport system component/predicted Ser/Thr protein kinase
VNGEQIGPYTILASLGEGGMGEVYRARDTRLDRLVALKVSKTAFDDRFEREARAVAAVSHPHICALYDVGPNYLVMELVDGVPLAGPLSVAQAVEYAAQILDALDAAHKKGITHRDLKPANILVTKHGIKLLDFGLAKQTQGPLGDAAQTMSALTTEGQIVGTLQYMAPEQLQGQLTDARADLFAFGCVLYELLSGKRAFDGASPASVIAAILERHPAPLTTHPPLDRVIATCLAKNPDERFQTALDTKRAMQWAMAQPAASSSTTTVSRTRERAWMAVAAATLVVSIGVAGWLYSRPSATVAAPRMMVNIDTPADADWSHPALSPDGTRIAFISPAGIVIRAIDSLEGQLIALPAPSSGMLAWAPDGTSLVFCSAANELQTVAAAGGAPRTLGAACGPAGRGLEWTADGTILFSVSGQPLSSIPAVGGVATPVTTFFALHPTMLPDGRHYLFLKRERRAREGTIEVGALDSADTHQVTDADSKAEFVAGHLVFMRGTTLMAQPFDLPRLATNGEAFPIAADVAVTPVSRAGQFSTAPNGLIVYATGGTGRTALTWLDRSGKELSVLDAGSQHNDVALSPDGRFLADTRVSPKTLEPQLWITDLSRGIASQLTPDTESAQFPAWSMDGVRVAYQDAANGIYTRDAAGAEPRKQVAAAGAHSWWSPDGAAMVIAGRGGSAGPIQILSLQDGTISPYLEVTATQPAVSPDGKWVAYAAQESGQSEVFVQSLPAGGGKWRISSAGGAQPVWRRDGRELFYRAGDGGIMAVPIAGAATFSPGPPQLLFRFESFGIPSTRRQFTISPDGQRFLVNKNLPRRGRAILLQNWLPQAQR